MGFIEITIILVTLVLGGYLLYVASEHGKKQKAYYEHEALNSFNRALSKLQDDTKMYRVFLYRKWPFQGPTWDPSSVTALKEHVVAGCTVHNPGGGGDVYTSSEFCISIDEGAKTIHFVIGETEFDFSNALQKKLITSCAMFAPEKHPGLDSLCCATLAHSQSVRFQTL